MNNAGCNRDGTSFSVLCGGYSVFTVAAANLLQLLVDGYGTFEQIHAIPSQAHGLGLPHSCKKGNNEQIFKLVTTDCLQECGYLVIVQWIDLRLFLSGKNAGIGRIGTDILIQHGLLQGTVQNALDLLDGFGSGAVFLLG